MVVPLFVWPLCNISDLLSILLADCTSYSSDVGLETRLHVGVTTRGVGEYICLLGLSKVYLVHVVLDMLPSMDLDGDFFWSRCLGRYEASAIHASVLCDDFW